MVQQSEGHESVKWRSQVRKLEFTGLGGGSHSSGRRSSLGLRGGHGSERWRVTGQGSERNGLGSSRSLARELGVRGLGRGDHRSER